MQEFATRVHETAMDHGWWDNEEDEQIGTKLALMHSEISEALEAYRDGLEDMYLDGDKPEGMIVELADCIIRIFDLSERYELDIVGALAAKADYNDTRPYRHGGRKV